MNQLEKEERLFNEIRKTLFNFIREHDISIAQALGILKLTEAAVIEIGLNDREGK